MNCNPWNNFSTLRSAKSFNEIADEDFCKTDMLACLSHSSTNDDIPSPITSFESNDVESNCCINRKAYQFQEYCVYKPADPDENSHLFSKLSIEKEIKINNLNGRIKELANRLDEEIEPVCIRDECSIAPKPLDLDLDSPSSNFMRRRRKTMK